MKLSSIGTMAIMLTWIAPALAQIERVERGNLVLENMPEVPAEVIARLEQYQNTRAASFTGWLPDGGLLIATRFGDTTQIHHVREPIGARRQITFFADPVSSASVPPQPDAHGFVFMRDSGGDEFFQLYWFDLASGSHRLLSDGVSRNTSPVWTNRGDRFAYSSTRRDGTNYDVYLARPTDDHHSDRLLLEGDGYWVPLNFAPDDDRLLVMNYRSINDSNIYVLDLESGELTDINPLPEPVGYGSAAFDASGRGVFVTHDHEAEFRHLYRLDLDTGITTALSADIPWDVSGFALTRARDRLVFIVNEGGMSRLHLVNAESGERLRGPALPVGLIGSGGFSTDGQRLALTVNTPQSPSDVYVFDLDAGSLQRWTESEVGGLDTARFPTPELVSFASFDGLEVPAWVFRPQGAGRSPVIVDIHGGPESQARPGFSPLTAYWVNELGAAVIRPNVRGSSGYGKSYLLLDNGVLREDSVRDIGALLDWIATQDDLDASRVVVYGGSYGGYMVLASLVHFGERLLGGVSIVGISNFVTFLENTEAYRRDLRRAEYGDERDPEMRVFLESISPLNNAERIRTPLFVAQGYNDPRVPYTESEQIVRAVRANEVDVWYLLAMDEGHGFARKTNRDYFQAATVLFLEQLFGR